MYCRNCGFEIMEGSKFCMECGTRVPQKEPIILTNHKDEMKKVIQELKKKVWYYFVDLKPEGPFTEEELVQLFEDGTIKPSTEIWHVKSDEAIPYVKKDAYQFEKEDSQEAEAIQDDKDFSIEEMVTKEVTQTIGDNAVENEPAAFEEPEQLEEESFIEKEPEAETVVVEAETEPEKETAFEEPEQSEEESFIEEESETETVVVEAEAEPQEETEFEEAELSEEEGFIEAETVVVETETVTESEEEIDSFSYIEDKQNLIDESQTTDQNVQETPKWYYANEDNNRHGPVTDTEFHDLIREGVIHEMAYIWAPGMNAWLYLKDSDQYSAKTSEPEEEVQDGEEVFGVDQYWEEEPEAETVITEAETVTESEEIIDQFVVNEENQQDLDDEFESQTANQNVQETPKWYYVDDQNNRHGPVTDTVFHDLIREGVIHEMTNIWAPGMSNWRYLKDSDQYSPATKEAEEAQDDAEVFGVDQYWEEEPESENSYQEGSKETEPEKKQVEANWYYVDRMNMRQGPLSTERIRSLIEEGVIHDKTYLWTAGLANWTLMKDTDFYQMEPQQTKDWYYIDAARVRHGKFSDKEMEQFLSQGVITENTYVWKAGMPQWAMLQGTTLSKREKVTVSKSNDDELWFYRGRDNSRVGPFSADEMKDLLNCSTINYQTDVWTRGMANWKSLSTTPLARETNRQEVQWYVQMHGQTMGPYPESTVLHMLRNNEINDRTYVWCAGMQDWDQIKNTSITRVK